MSIGIRNNYLEIDRDLQDIIICALRYAIGRKSYVTWEVSDYIMEHPELIDKRVKEVMLFDLQDKELYYKTTDIDYIQFRKLETWLKDLEVK